MNQPNYNYAIEINKAQNGVLQLFPPRKGYDPRDELFPNE
jgi:hypothetical protein